MLLYLLGLGHIVVYSYFNKHNNCTSRNEYAYCEFMLSLMWLLKLISLFFSQPGSGEAVVYMHMYIYFMLFIMFTFDSLTVCVLFV